MAAPFKIKSTVTRVLYSITYQGSEKFSSKSGRVAARAFKSVRNTITFSDQVKLVRKTTTIETLIVP